MIEPTLRAFCESRHRWLIVISVTLGIGLVTLLPLVDDYFAGKSEKTECMEELRNARLDAADLDTLKSRVAELTAQLDGIEKRTVSESTVAEYRSQLVDLARTSGCQLRRITVGTAQSRPWYKGNDPIENQPKTATKKKSSGLELERQPLALSVSGSMSSLKSLLEQIRNDQLLMHVKNMELRPTGQDRKQVILDLELWFFDLNVQAAAAT